MIEEVPEHEIEMMMKWNVHPMNHKEARWGIQMLKDGANVLKHWSDTHPHIRYFQLSDDNERLVWFSTVREV